MKRREFINYAVLFAAARHLSFPLTQEEMFRFDLSYMQGLLKKIPKAERETATLMMKNLLYDMEYIFKQANNKTDLTTLKKLAEQADKKFYSENKLKATSFSYQPLTQNRLEEMNRNPGLKPGEFDAMIKSIKYYSDKINASKEKFEKLIPALMKEADQAAQMQKAEEKRNCLNVISVIIAVILVIIAIVVAVFTFGAGAALIALKVIAAGAIIGGAVGTSMGNELLSAALTGTNAGIAIQLNGKYILDEKVKVPWVDFDKRLKCAFLSAVNAVTMTVFGNKSYPSNAIIGSVAVNIMAITKQLPEIETNC